MKRKWCLQRQFVERQDGQRRWDKAYQLLMEMTKDVSEPSDSAPTQAEFVRTVDVSGEPQ